MASYFDPAVNASPFARPALHGSTKRESSDDIRSAHSPDSRLLCP